MAERMLTEINAVTTESDRSLPLTDEQERIAFAPPEARMLVTAGPGTGKTHTLVARLVALTERYELSPGSEILVLSFSRAAVGEIRRRLANSEHSARYVTARTFDSFATRLLTDVVPSDKLAEWDYEERISALVSLIFGGDEIKERLADYVHIIIDELQDVAGARADLVRALLETCNCGFTLLGDPAQGIYNFSLEGEARRTGAGALYKWVRDRFSPNLRECSLSVNHRAKTSAAKLALWAGEELNGPDPDYEQIRFNLDTIVLSLPSIGKPEVAYPVLRASKGPTAVLCRDNGQALIISRGLLEAGIAHRYQRDATDRALPPWIAVSLAGLDRDDVSKASFLRHIEAALPDGVTNPQAAWSSLKSIEGRRSGDLNLPHLSLRIRTGNVPDEITRLPPAMLTVSTIHRAKGLEFDAVVVVGAPRQQDEDEVTFAEETRTLYVALTRPKYELKHMPAVSAKGLYKCKATERWVRRYETWHFVEFEVRGSDVYSLAPAGGYLLMGCDPPDTQGYVREHVKPDDPIVLQKIDVADAPDSEGYYAIMHNGRAVGVTSPQFGTALYRTLRTGHYRQVTWPSRMEQLWVECVDTVAGDSAVAIQAGLGACPLWLRVRVAGLGRLKVRINVESLERCWAYAF